MGTKTFRIAYSAHGVDGKILKDGHARVKKQLDEFSAQYTLEMDLKKTVPGFHRLTVYQAIELIAGQPAQNTAFDVAMDLAKKIDNEINRQQK